jgi:uncharacterized protein YllA (UPF0747 family)
LYGDFLYDFKRVAHLYPHPPLDLDSYIQSAQDVDYPASRRTRLIEALAAVNPPGSPLLERLAQPGAVAVVTGQQVGLLGGPAYSLYKALTAVRIAEALTEAGQPAVPVFWLATEDHDFAEVDHAWILDGGHQPSKVQSQGDWVASQPVGGVRLTSLPQDSLAAAMANAPFGQGVLDMVRAAYVPRATFGDAFRQVMIAVLGRLCPLFIDPLEPAIRSLAAPLLTESARRSAELTGAVIARSSQLKNEGYHAQVLLEGKDATLFFALEGDLAHRPSLRRVSLRGGSPESVAAERLSPNALLRPVVQDYLLPTAVMVGGPAEIAYLAQSAPLYDKLLGRQAVAVPRQGFTLLDPRCAKLMDRLTLRLPEVAKPEEDVLRLIARRLSPPALGSAFDEAAAQTGGALDRLHHQLAAFDPTLGAALAKGREKIVYQLAKTRRKAEAEVLRRDQRAAAESEYLIRYLYPHRHLQERFYTVLPFLASHGMDLAEQIYPHVHLGCPDHNVLAL